MRNFKTKYNLVALLFLFYTLNSSCEKKYIDVVQTLQYEVINSPTQTTIFSVKFINDRVGFIGCDSSKIYKTIDGGINWSDISIKPFLHPYGHLIGNGPVNKILAISENRLFASVNGDVLKSIDGGITWSLIDYGLESDIDFYDDKIGYAIINYSDFNSKLLRT
ncbi:Ycf48-like protein [compost metagenome]